MVPPEGEDNAEQAKNDLETEVSLLGKTLSETGSEGSPTATDADASEAAWAEGLAIAAEKLFESIERSRIKQWKRYLELADKLGPLSQLALRRSGANDRRGWHYSRAMSGLLETHAPKLSDRRLEVLRAALISIYEHRDGIEQWRKTWTLSEQQKWLSPITVWRHYEAKFIKGPAKEKRVSESDQQKTDFVQQAAEAVERKHLENRRLRVNALLDCDDAEIVALIWEVRDDASGIIALLQQGRGARVREADGWPVEARRPESDDDESGGSDDPRRRWIIERAKELHAQGFGLSESVEIARREDDQRDDAADGEAE
jgi:hypothetical protein